MNICSYVQAYISMVIDIWYLHIENTNDNECMIMGILLHWYYSIDWLTLVWCICEHVFIWTNETPMGTSKIFNIQKGEPFSTGGGIILINPWAYKWAYPWAYKWANIWKNKCPYLSHTYLRTYPMTYNGLQTHVLSMVSYIQTYYICKNNRKYYR